MICCYCSKPFDESEKGCSVTRTSGCIVGTCKACMSREVRIIG